MQALVSERSGGASHEKIDAFIGDWDGEMGRGGTNIDMMQDQRSEGLDDGRAGRGGMAGAECIGGVVLQGKEQFFLGVTRRVVAVDAGGGQDEVPAWAVGFDVHDGCFVLKVESVEQQG